MTSEHRSLAVRTTALSSAPSSPKPTPPPPSPHKTKQLINTSTSNLHSSRMIRLRSYSAHPNPRRRILIFSVLTLLVTAVFVLYYVFFHHGPVSSILEKNVIADQRKVGAADDYEFFEEEEQQIQALRTPEGSKRIWKKFIVDGKYVSIGDVYNTCEERLDRLQIGKTILTATEDGKLRTKTYSNFTLEKEVNDGEFIVDVKYNGKDLYNNRWSLCTMERNSKNRIVFCPFKKGVHKLVKIVPVPYLLPKGTYSIVVRVTNQDDQLFICSKSRLVL